MATQARTRKHTDDDKRSGPRPMWKGAVTFGLVTVPVALHPATERKNELSFRLLHARDESPIDYKRVCHEEGVEVPWAEIVKGYALAKDRYVVVTDEDFAKARVPGTQTFEIRDFVPGTSIDDFYFTQPYYVAPAGQALVLTTLRWAYELRAPSSLGLPSPTTARDRRELELALRLIETLAADWDPKRYKDTYREVLLDIIERKAAGKPIRTPRVERQPKVRSLMSALEASLRERKPATKAAGRRHRRAA